jgi:CelD/BcsL family acetyltransferase involved in cellulose biosynthesis
VHGTIEAGIHVELRRLSELAAFAGDLRALIERARAPNVFYEPAFMAASAPVFGRDALVGLVWGGARLIGFFPVTIERRRYGLTLPVLTGWTHPYAPLGTPLVDRESGEEAIAAWLERIAADASLPKLLLMPYLPARCAAMFETGLADRGGRCAEFDYHARALLRPDNGRDRYLDVAIPHKKRKELRRLRKRLADAGILTSKAATAAPTLNAALCDFLALEASGWKGRSGTAAQSNDDIRQFVETVVTTLAAEGKASVARLALDGHAIAAIVTLRSGDTAWCWKIAYDENYARHSPGVQLLLDVTQDLLNDTRIARADSCATPDHPMIDHIWRERLVLSDRLISVTPCSAVGFASICALESLRRNGINMARSIRNRLKKKHRTRPAS